MNIQEKMKICFSNALMENTILTDNEKKVLAVLLYSYQVCSKKNDDDSFFMSMTKLRKEASIKYNDMYDAIRNLELLYHMIERIPGESWTKGQKVKASKWYLNFEAIFNPPTECVKFVFPVGAKPSETSMGTINKNKIINKNKNRIINKTETKNKLKTKDIKEKESILIDTVDSVAPEETINGWSFLAEEFNKKLEEDRLLTEQSLKGIEMGSGV